MSAYNVRQVTLSTSNLKSNYEMFLKRNQELILIYYTIYIMKLEVHV